MKTYLTKFFFRTALVAVIAFVIASISLYLYLEDESDPRFTKSFIMKILAKESAVYFSDEKTKIGAFFQDSHREYMPFDSIPVLLGEAVISSEDKKFYKHSGIDYKALFYAQFDNLISMKAKRGGSTISQQTIKNLFFKNETGLWNRIKRKLPEFFMTLKLETRFSKQEILEFYLNQFYVSGNGKGVSIAARYFFNKSLKQLELEEAAFIAGSVKGPYRYDPFVSTKKDPRKNKLRRAKTRTMYVLKRMYLDKKISQKDYEKAKKTPLKFKRGRFRFKLSTNMVQIKRIMDSPPIKKSLSNFDIHDYMTAGLKIYTTLDAKLQEAASYHLYKNLSQLDVKLNGYHSLGRKKQSLSRTLKPGAFITGRICSLVIKNKIPIKIQVQFKTKKVWIKKPALDVFNTSWNLHKTGKRGLPSKKLLKQFYKKNLLKGDYIYGSLSLNKKEKIFLSIEQKPEIQGAALILKDGEILANVGGYGNTGYNRVFQSKRQFGSTFKPFVYAAALELGWSPMDVLPNKRQLFKLGNTFYFPRPAHKPEPKVSMMWAGRNSENISSVYLLYHLMDKLSPKDFWETASQLGLAPKNFSSPDVFKTFVRDEMGLILTRRNRLEIYYDQLISDFEVDLIFEGRDQEAQFLKSLPYGIGFKKELKKYSRQNKKEPLLRKKILKHSFLQIKEELEKWKKQPNPSIWIDSSNQYSIGGVKLSNHWSRVSVNLDTIEQGSILWKENISLKTIAQLEEKLDLAELGPSYNSKELYHSREFKALVAHAYIVKFSQKLGIQQTLDGVMSYPLGSNTITLLDATSAYQTLKDGARYTSEQIGTNHIFIKSITLSNGTIVYQDTITKTQVLSQTAKHGIQSILKNIIEGGTGAKVSRELTLRSTQENLTLKVPAYGKTGTTNDYRNGAFIGFISGPPSIHKDPFSPEDGYSIGVYVGFDNNKKMKRRGFIGYGGTVSLPTWIPIAQSIVKIKNYRSQVDFLDLNLQVSHKIPLKGEEELTSYKVYKKNGLLFSNNESLDSSHSKTVTITIQN